MTPTVKIEMTIEKLLSKIINTRDNRCLGDIGDKEKIKERVI